MFRIPILLETVNTSCISKRSNNEILIVVEQATTVHNGHRFEVHGEHGEFGGDVNWAVLAPKIGGSAQESYVPYFEKVKKILLLIGVGCELEKLADHNS